MKINPPYRLHFINPQHWVSITDAGEGIIDGKKHPIYDIKMTDGSVIADVALIEEKEINGIGSDLIDLLNN